MESAPAVGDAIHGGVVANPTQATIKRLFAQSGEFCMHPDCGRHVVDHDTGTIMVEVCHINARSPGGSRYDPVQTEKERNAYENLILLCGDHHKLVDARPDQYSSEVLRELKQAHQRKFGRSAREGDDSIAKSLLKSYVKTLKVERVSGNVVVNDAKSVNIRTVAKKVVVGPAPGTIGADQKLVRYIDYLIRKYIDFASKDPFQTRKFNPGRFRKNLEQKFRAHWKNLPVEKADDLTKYLQDCIDKTSLAKLNKSKGVRAYSSMQEYE